MLNQILDIAYLLRENVRKRKRKQEHALKLERIHGLEKEIQIKRKNTCELKELLENIIK